MFYGTPPIVTNGLVLNLDAANRLSYPTSGTTWTDLSGFGNNGTLTNGPTFNPNNSGIIVFDGVDDYVTGPIQNSSLYTLAIWIKPITYTVGGGLLAGGNSEIYLQLGGGSTWQFLNAFSSGVGPTLGRWFYVVGVENSVRQLLYVNGGLISSVGSTSSTLGTSYRVAQRVVGNVSTNCQVGVAHIYNRALTQSEILQNYNALKGRYGIN